MLRNYPWIQKVSFFAKFIQQIETYDAKGHLDAFLTPKESFGHHVHHLLEHLLSIIHPFSGHVFTFSRYRARYGHLDLSGLYCRYLPAIDLWRFRPARELREHPDAQVMSTKSEL